LDVYLIDESKKYTLQFSANQLDNVSKSKEKKFTTADTINFSKVDISYKKDI